jgi:hypothetical protein
MVGDGKEIRELCGRVAKEQELVKLRELIGELSRLLQEGEESQKSKFPIAEINSKKSQQNPTT